VKDSFRALSGVQIKETKHLPPLSAYQFADFVLVSSDVYSALWMRVFFPKTFDQTHPRPSPLSNLVLTLYRKLEGVILEDKEKEAKSIHV